MNLLADESVDRMIVVVLRQEGHAVESVAESDPSIADEEVLRRAAESARVLLTADKDFGELVFRLRRVHAGVVLLRLAGLTSAERAALVAEVVRVHGSELVGGFTVVTPESVRIRQRRSGEA
jgi:predicted nuclease of predicted toxin-antitoxin system